MCFFPQDLYVPYLLCFPLVVVTSWSPPPVATSAVAVVRVDAVLSTNTASPVVCIQIKYSIILATCIQECYYEYL